MEILIQEEIDKCIDMLRKEVGKPTQLNLKLNIAILNALWKLLTGEKVQLKKVNNKHLRIYYIEVKYKIYPVQIYSCSLSMIVLNRKRL